jgi:hypothetical protein
MHRVKQLAEKLDRLRGLDVNKTVFGVAPPWGYGHEYRLNPTLNNVQLFQFERKYKIQLPEDYRAFLQQVGNGGAGPYYGLLPIEQGLPEDLAGLGDQFLSTPFPHNDAYEPQLGEERPKSFWAEYESEALVAGSLRIAHQGFNYYDILVVAGPMKGTIWTDARTGEMGITPLGIGFYDWYDRWLDTSIAEIESNPPKKP